MSYAAIVGALKTAFEAVTPPAGTTLVVLDYEPTAIHHTPTLYLILDGFERNRGLDGTVTTTYNVMATLVLRWQDNEQAEQDVVDLVDSIGAALDADMSLGGMNGEAMIVDADAGYADISGTKYRIVEFGVQAREITCL